MATRLGTAYVDVEPDFSAFDRMVAKRLGSSFADAGERSGRDFNKGFDKNTSGLLLPVSRALRDVGKEATLAGNSTKQFGADTSKAAAKAQSAVKSMGKEIASVPDLPTLDLSRTGRVDLQIAGASASAKQLRTELDALTSKPRTVEVDAEIGRLVAKLDQAEAKVAQLEAKRIEIKADVDRTLPGKLNSISTSVTSLMASLGAGGGGGIGGATARISAGFISFGATAAPLAAVLAGLAVVIGTALVGALVALASSLALAAAGAAALGVAMGGVLGAGLALLIPVAIRVGKIFESLKADNAAADAVARNSAAGSAAAAAAAKAQAAAARGLTSANRSLAEASRAVGVAAKDAYREMADAAEAASDAIREVTTSQISLDRAKLSTERARLELAQFRNELGATGTAFGEAFRKFTDVSVDTSGLRKAISDANAQSGGKLSEGQELDLRDKILAVREARDREKQAVDAVSDATRAASRAQEIDNQFKRQGIAASQAYQGALKAQASAQRGVADARRAVVDANAAAAAGTGIAAQEKATQLAGKLTKAEVRLKDSIKDVGKALRGAFTPATDAVISGMTTALGRIPAIVNPLRGSFKRLGEAWADSIKTFSGDLIRPDSISKMRAFTDGAAKLAGPVTRGISALLDILTDIGRAALPYLISGTKKVADRMERWAKTTGNTEKLDKAIGSIVGHLKTWLGVAGALGGTFVAFIKAAAGPGQGLAESIKDLADRTTKWLNSKEGREELKRFFADAIEFAKDLAAFFGRLITKVADIASEIINVAAKFRGAKGAADGLLVVLGTVFAFKAVKGVVGAVSDIHKGLTGAHKAATVLHSKLLAGAAGDAASTGLAAKAKGVVTAVAGSLKSAGAAVVTAGRAVARRLIAVFATQGALAGAAAGNAAAGTEGLAGAGMKSKMSGAGRSLGRAIGRGMLAGLLLAIPALIAQFQQKITDALGLSEGLKNFDATAGPTAAFNAFKKLLGLNAGGPVPGYGTRDTVPAWLTPGEYVNTAPIVRRYTPGVFADINAGRLDPRIGYERGQRPSVGPVRASGPRLASGGLAGVMDRPATQRIAPTFPITVVGGGPPDVNDLAVKTSRVIESRYGGDVRQD